MKTYKDQKKRHYLFDWDNNILHMDTLIRVDTLINNQWLPIDVKSDEYSKIRPLLGSTYRIREDSFNKFSDENQFLFDVSDSIENKNFGPSFNKFKECLIYVNDFAIITARSHSSQALRDGVGLIPYRTLNRSEWNQMLYNLGDEGIESYLDRQEYYGVSGKDFREKFNTDVDIKVEESKKLAIEDYVTKIIKSSKKLIEEGIINTISIGFSDDDMGNINSVEKLIHESLSKKYPHVTFVIYDTSNNLVNKKVFI